MLLTKDKNWGIVNHGLTLFSPRRDEGIPLVLSLEFLVLSCGRGEILLTRLAETTRRKRKRRGFKANQKEKCKNKNCGIPNG
jgi:hypothetical protein